MYHPILCKFQDEQIEQRLSKEENMDLQTRYERAVATQNERVSTHNVVNHEPRVKLSAAKMKRLTEGGAHKNNGVPDSKTPWNIVSNKDFGPNKQLNDYQKRHMVHRRSDRKLPGSQMRDFNVLSNKYLIDDEGKQKVDREARLQYAAAKFWQHNEQNPVAGTYYSDDKENQYQEACEMKATIQGLTALNGLPPSYKQREGHAYNLLTNEINELNPLLSQSSRDSQERTLQMQGRFLKDPQRVKAETDWRQRSFIQENRQESRRLKRAGLRPSIELTGSRYDLLTAEDRKRIQLRNSGTLLQMGQSGHSEVSLNDAWTRMSRGVQSGRGGGGASMQHNSASSAIFPQEAEPATQTMGYGTQQSARSTARASSRLSIFD